MVPLMKGCPLLSIVIALGAPSLVACAPEKVTVNLRTVLDEAAQNELGPTARLSDRNLVLEGLVVRTGMKNEDSREDSAHIVGPGLVSGESRGVITQAPYAIIEPGDDKPGRCMCFFDLASIARLADYKPKSKIRVYARLQRFLRQGAHEVLAADCVLPE